MLEMEDKEWIAREEEVKSCLEEDNQTRQGSHSRVHDNIDPQDSQLRRRVQILVDAAKMVPHVAKKIPKEKSSSQQLLQQTRLWSPSLLTSSTPMSPWHILLIMSASTLQKWKKSVECIQRR